MSEDLNGRKISALEKEYASLREEFLFRIEMRQRLIEITLTFTAAILGLALTNEAFTSIALVYPVLAFFLALSWRQHDIKINYLTNYIRDYVEKDMGLGWGNFKKEKRQKKDPHWGMRLAPLSHGGVFFVTQTLAILIVLIDKNNGIFIYLLSLNLQYQILFVVDCFCVLGTGIMLMGRSKYHRP